MEKSRERFSSRQLVDLQDLMRSAVSYKVLRKTAIVTLLAERIKVVILKFWTRLRLLWNRRRQTAATSRFLGWEGEPGSVASCFTRQTWWVIQKRMCMYICMWKHVVFLLVIPYCWSPVYFNQICALSALYSHTFEQIRSQQEGKAI